MSLHKKPRKTLAKRIRELVSANDIETADELCTYGQQLSQPANHVVSYREVWRLFNAAGGSEAMKTTPATNNQQPNALGVHDLYRILKRQEKVLCDIFINAIRNADVDKIMELVEGVILSKDHPPFTSVDPRRRWILLLKMRLAKHGSTMTVSQVVNFLNAYTTTKIRQTDDGYSQIRRLCKELDFPLTKSKKNKRK
jgi:hypothetical protein